jgi:uncharacterized RDD family membrane protein YckC
MTGTGGNGGSSGSTREATQTASAGEVGAQVSSAFPESESGQAPWTCPVCGIINTPGSTACDCGYGREPIASSGVITPDPPRPWLRYWARTFDYFLCGLVFGPAFAISEGNKADAGFFIAGLLTVLLWIPLEAASLSTIGTTPGKWLFNIRLSDQSGGRLPFTRALRRAFSIAKKGLGLGIPPVAFFTLVFSYYTLTRRGKTSWDQELGIVVRHGPVRAGRILGILLASVQVLGWMESCGSGR